MTQGLNQNNMENTKLKENPNGQNKMIIKLPTMAELVKEEDYKANALMVLLNQPPPKEWIKEHPIAKVKVNGVNVPAKYIPRERVEYLLSRIYTKWWVEIKDVKLVANSVVVVVRLFVINPITQETEWNDGIGAAQLQTDAGAGATEFDKIKSSAVQMAAPSAETYALKDAAEKFGKLFGKDLNVADIDYTNLLKDQVQVEDLELLLDTKRGLLSKEDLKRAEQIIKDKETSSYKTLFNTLKNK